MLSADERKEARTYAWSYFALHADQRLRLFNFFLILSGSILGAFAAVKGFAQNAKWVAAMPMLLAFTSFIFWRLEERTRQLVKNAESTIRFLDKELSADLLPDGSPHYVRLFERDDYFMEREREQLRRQSWLRRQMPLSYAQSFRFAFIMVAGLGIILTLWVLFS